MKLLLLIFLLAPASLAFLAPLAAFRSPHALQSSTDAPESPSPATPEAPTTESPAPKLKMRKRAAKIVAVDSSPLRGSDSDAVEEVAVVFEGTTYAITSNFEGNGGFFIEVEVNNKGAGSRHTIIVAKEWQGELEEKAGRGTDPETIAKYVLHFFLQKKFKVRGRTYVRRESGHV